MRVAIYDRVEPPAPTTLPLRLVQKCSHRGATLFLVVMIPAAMVLATAVLLLILEAAFAPAARAAVGRHPALALEVFAAIGFSSYLLWLPMRRLLARLVISRRVEIDAETVRVEEGSPFGAWTWTAPLAAYVGVAHHVRASLSGTRHELILVHPEREKSVLLSVAPRTSQAEVIRVVTLLGTQEIPPSELYRFKAPWLRAGSRDGAAGSRDTRQTMPDAAHV